MPKVTITLDSDVAIVKEQFMMTSKESLMECCMGICDPNANRFEVMVKYIESIPEELRGPMIVALLIHGMGKFKDNNR